MCLLITRYLDYSKNALHFMQPMHSANAGKVTVPSASGYALREMEITSRDIGIRLNIRENFMSLSLKEIIKLR